MSYVAIARKWRPTTFDDIAGQQHVTRTLCNAIRLDRIHHAFLFTGARGVGKTSAARVLARALNCAEGPTATPCGECPSCLEILGGSSPDVIEIDGASNNSVDDIRELRESVRYLPQRGRRKVYIVDEVHMLSRGAFNALLKTLEEPPEHVVFIFATTEPQKIPDTILSRVQRFDFKRIPATVVVETLRRVCEGEGIAIPDGGLRLIARAGEGSMRDSQSLLDRVISFGGETISTEQVADVLGLVDRELLYSMLGGILQGEADRCLEAIEQVYSFGFDLSEFTSEMLELLRNATLVGLSPSSQRYLDVPDEERGRLQDLVGDVPTDVFVRSFQVMLEVHEQVARAPRPRLVLEMAVARLVSIRPARPVDQIVQRLGDIERRIRHGGVIARPRSGGQGPSVGGARGSKDDDGEPARAQPAPSPAPPAPAARPRPVVPRAPSPAPAPAPAAAAPAPQVAAAPPAAPPARRPAASSMPEDDRWAPMDVVASGPVAPPTAAPHAQEAPEPAWPEPPEHRPSGAPPPDLFSVEPLEGVGDADSIAPVESAAPPPPIPAGADENQRFEVFQSWLEGGGSRYLSLALDAALDGVQAPTVTVTAPHELHQRNITKITDDPRVLEGVTACFPGCNRLSVRLRAGGGGETRRERQEAARRAQLDALRAVVVEQPVVQGIEKLFQARLTEVRLPDEPPAVAQDHSAPTRNS